MVVALAQTYIHTCFIYLESNILAPEVNACKRRKLKFSEFSGHTAMRPKPRTGIRVQHENLLKLAGFLFFRILFAFERE